MVKKKNKNKKIPSSVRSLLSEATAELLKKCSSNVSASGNQLWENFTEISKLVDRIKELELAYGKRADLNRADEWNSFTKWAQEQEIEFSNLVLRADTKSAGLGLQTACNVKENELIIKVPRSAMVSVENVRNGKISSLLEKDPILQAMPNIALSLYLLYEISEPNSAWKPYFNILPQTYNTILYFSNDELQLLKGSPMFDQALKFQQNIARQYAYFYRIFNNDPELKTLPIREYFTFENYRWAVSTVMTRQNTIPCKEGGGGMVNVLIPVWDMCNHLHGKVSTDYNEEKEACECYAMKNFSSGSEVFICYGKRSNAEFFLHNGFVYPPNENDSLEIRLGVSKSDILYDKKIKLLNQIGVDVSGACKLFHRQKPMDVNTSSFLRVFLMSKDEVDSHLLKGAQELPEIQEKEFELILNFLKTRAMLLLKTYPTSLENDLEVLSKTDEETAEHVPLAHQLIVCEKRILMSYAEDVSN